MSDGRRHPEPATLEAFALGRLDGDEMERVEAHLAGCPSCGRRVQDVPDDRLVRLLRRSPTPLPGPAGPA